jgi:type IV pilus assembly protein PilA
MKTLQKGFTLIELMIVVAIIGILAAIALPAYQDYTIRAQVTEGLNLAEGVKTAVADYYAQNGTMPAAVVTTATTANGLGYTRAPEGKYVSSVDLKANGVVVVTFSNAGGKQANATINTKTLEIDPGVSENGDIIWRCGLKPAPTLGGTPLMAFAASNATSLVAKYLPSSCK